MYILTNRVSDGRSPGPRYSRTLQDDRVIDAYCGVLISCRVENWLRRHDPSLEGSVVTRSVVLMTSSSDPMLVVWESEAYAGATQQWKQVHVGAINPSAQILTKTPGRHRSYPTGLTHNKVLAPRMNTALLRFLADGLTTRSASKSKQPSRGQARAMGSLEALHDATPQVQCRGPGSLGSCNWQSRQNASSTADHRSSGGHCFVSPIPSTRCIRERSPKQRTSLLAPLFFNAAAQSVAFVPTEWCQGFPAANSVVGVGSARDSVSCSATADPNDTTGKCGDT